MWSCRHRPVRRPARRSCCFVTDSAVHQAIDGPLEINGGTAPGAYRVEGYTANAPGGPRVPWLVSNPIYVGLESPPSPATAAEPAVRESPRAPTREPPNLARGIPASSRPSSRADQGTRTFAGDPALEWKFSLSPGRRPVNLRRCACRCPEACRGSSGSGFAFRRRRRCACGCSCARRSVTPSGGEDLLRRYRLTRRRCRVREVQRRSARHRRGQRRSIGSIPCCSWPTH